MVTDPGSDTTQLEVCTSYTFARRMPTMIGRLRSRIGGDRGITLPGGPYAVTQLVAAGLTLLVLAKTRGLWAADNRVVTVTVFLCLPVAVGWLVRRGHVDGRPILAAAVGALRYVTAVHGGTLSRWLDDSTGHRRYARSRRGRRTPSGRHRIPVTITHPQARALPTGSDLPRGMR